MPGWTRSPGSGLGVWSPGKLRKSSTLVRAVSRSDPVVAGQSRSHMRDVSGVKSSIVKNKGEGEGTATPFISANDAHGVVGRRPLGYGSRCTVCSAATSTGVSRRHRRAGLLDPPSNVLAVSPEAASLTPRSEGGATAPAAASATASTIVCMRAIVFVLGVTISDGWSDFNEGRLSRFLSQGSR